MNIETLIRLAPQLLPLLPDIDKMIATLQSAEVQQALVTAKKLAELLEGAKP